MARAIRVGLMVPASNTTMAGEMPGWLPPGSSVTRLGIALDTPGREDMERYRDAVVALAEATFSPDSHDVLAFGCTAAGFVAGPRGDAELAEGLARATGLPVVTTAGAMVAGLREVAARDIAVVTPYQDETNARLRDFLLESGIGVRRLETLRAADIPALCRITAPEVEALARATMGADCEALFIACTQLPTQPFLAALAADFARPVLSAISATAAAAGRAQA
jgi:maleate cis-trans isomerase